MAMLTGVRILARPRTLMLVLPIALALGMPHSSVAAPLAAGGDPIYMNFTNPNIPGDATAKGHEKWIEVSSYQWGLKQSIDAGTGLPTGKVKFNEFTITKTIDRASPFFFLGSAAGTHYETVTIAMRKAGGDSFDYFKLTMSNVLISGYSLSSGGDRPTESITINFAKIVVTYTPQQPDGNLEAPIQKGWDLEKNLKMF